MENNAIDHRKVQDGLDFILNHFQGPLFPRKIMTRKLGYQVEIFNKIEALEYFKSSNYEDCRINAYPSFTEYHGINRTSVSFLMVDLDLKDFADEKKEEPLKRASKKTLRKIKESIGGNPTVLWTGNGYHIYQPVSGFILEEYETFYKFTKYFDKDLTSMFQYAEEYFTDYTADRLHNPTVKSCLVRIPGSLNSKSVAKGEDAEVKAIQKWDGIRPSIQPLLRHFRIWLAQKKIDAFEELKKQEKFQMTVSNKQERTNTIKWIERGILEHTLADHRKYIIWRILSPYLLNVRKLPKEEAYSVMKEWLDKCDNLEKLTFNPKTKIKDGLRCASKGYLPISMEKLKEENRQLYNLILDRIRS
jgi:Primase X